jgi:hypothetical protein
MARITHATAAKLQPNGYYEAMFSRVGPLLPKTTVTQMLEHWLKGHALGQWTTKSMTTRGVMVVWFDKADFDAAKLHFKPNKPWAARSSGAIDGFHHQI